LPAVTRSRVLTKETALPVRVLSPPTVTPSPSLWVVLLCTDPSPRRRAPDPESSFSALLLPTAPAKTALPLTVRPWPPAVVASTAPPKETVEPVRVLSLLRVTAPP